MERLNFKIGISGEDKKMKAQAPMTLAKAVSLIKAKEYPKAIEDELIKELSKKPKATYRDFLKNIYTHMTRIQERKNKE